ncbi:MAG: hypothetical protein V7676_05025 [Parasphingorhabdus sp.]|uniref:hypothetical protein n=1 Tax=Parasphingorhabdus sp. TaxID=2709688 RepID=UPI003001B28E
MKRTMLALPILSLLLVSCGEEPKETPTVEERLTEYKAVGTEPGWSVEIKDDVIAYSSIEATNDFSLPVARMKKTEAGWEIKGFTDHDNITVTIALGKECNDGMSDLKYADTVNIAVSGSGHHDGCGGDILSDPEAT